MPTFKSVAEAGGAPAISPFEPPDTKDADEERELRELREFVASFRYNPPDEAVDELTMRSEIPVIDAEAPVTPSHPSFDDDVPPPPEAGPHPTGEEYYPPLDPATGRSRFLDIAEPHHSSAARHVPATAGKSLLGLGDPQPAFTSLLDDLDQPPRRRWLLWSSLAVLATIFGGLGYLEGRAQMNHTGNSPVAVIRQQYQKLRQRISALNSTVPAAPGPEPAAPEATKPAEPQTSPPAQDQSATNANAPVGQPATAPEQQQAPPAAVTPAPARAKEESAAAPPPASTPATQPPTPDTAASTPQPAKPLEAPIPTSKSKHEPGQQELDNAMQAGDATAAAAWLWKSTSRGNPEAPVRLADLYIKGKGVPRSCEQALVLLRSAASKENAPARNRLAALYANGTCVPRDRVKAYQLMSSALVADPGSEWAEQNRKELWNQMTPQERTQAEKYR
jgi:TPR repeat protein